MYVGPEPSQSWKLIWWVVLIPPCFTQNWRSLNSRRKESPAALQYTIVIENDFFDESKRWLQTAPEENQHLNVDKLTKWKIARIHWRLTAEEKVTTSYNKLIVPKKDIYNVLCEAHSAIAYWGRDKTERYIRQSYAGISQDVVNCISNKKVWETTGRNQLPMFALKNKETEEVAVTLTNLFWLFGFPSILHPDNGKELTQG